MHNNLKSPGYARSLTWISETWYDLKKHIIQNSFEYCGINQKAISFINASNNQISIEIDTNDLHSVLKQILVEKAVFHNYISNELDSDQIFYLNECELNENIPVDNSDVSINNSDSISDGLDNSIPLNQLQSNTNRLILSPDSSSIASATASAS